MTIESATNLPPHFRNALLALEPFMSAHPRLCDTMESVRVDEDLHVWVNINPGIVFKERQAAALAHPGLKWKRERGHSDYHWLATDGDVTVTIRHAEPLEYSYEPSLIDMEAFAKIHAEQKP